MICLNKNLRNTNWIKLHAVVFGRTITDDVYKFFEDAGYQVYRQINELIFETIFVEVNNTTWEIKDEL